MLSTIALGLFKEVLQSHDSSRKVVNTFAAALINSAIDCAPITLQATHSNS